MDKLEDLENFLKNIDKISELVSDMNSADVEVQQKAVEKADCYLAALDEPCRTKVNKTAINTNPPLQTPLGPQSESPENFMKIMERDADDRRKKRIAKEQKATAFKDKGNEAFAQEDYEMAVKYYSEGLAELRDMQHLYTNRAQAYIKLEKYKEAINDCEWALKCNERCLKAYLHMGKAYLALKNYNESRNCFEKIMEIEPGKEKMVKEYLTRVNLVEEKESQEMNARQEFEKGEGKAITVPQLLEKLSRRRQMPLYYCGGLAILSQVVTDCTGQTLFRLNNGFSIISDNDTVRSCLLQKTKDPHRQDLCLSVLKLWRLICCGNDENQKMLMTCPVFRQSVVYLVTSEHVSARKECLELLCLYSKMPHGRHLALDTLNVHMLVGNLMACVSKPEQQQEYTAVKILENFEAENKFRIKLRNGTDAVIEPFTATLRNISKSNQHILPSLISAIGCLTQDDVIRHNFANDPECWKAFLVAIRQCSECGYKEILYPLLGLIINLSTIISPVIQEHAVSLCGCCLGLLRDDDGGVITRATGVLSTVLPQSTEAVEHVIQGSVVQTMRRLLKGTGPTATKYAIKTLTVCTAASHLAREELVKSDKKLSIIRHLLGSSCDEMVSGNAALCLAHCLELEGAASSLLGTDIVLLLLRHAAGDAKRTAVQKNAAIALGKLCSSEPRHVNKLRELHGLEILHSLRAEKDDFQGYHTEQIKGMTVTKDQLMKKEHTIGRGTEAIPKENTLRHTAVAVTAKFSEAILFDTRPVPPYERTQITKDLAAISPSRERFVSRNGQNSLNSTRDNASVMRIPAGSEIPLITNYEKIVFSSTQAAFESMVNGTTEPGVHLSADAVKASLWLHTLLYNMNQRNTESITLTSADGGPGVPILPASHPHVIDNLAAQHNDNDDKQSQGKDEKGISNLSRNEYLFSTLPSVFQNDTAEDSLTAYIMTNLCLTCLKDRREVSTEKSVALPPLSPDSSSPSRDSLQLDFNQFITSLPSLQQQSFVQREKMLSKDKSHQNITMQSSVSVREKTVNNQTSFSKTVNHSQNTMNNSRIGSFLSDTVTVDTRPHAEMSSESQKDTKKQLGHTNPSETFVTVERPISTTAALYRSSKSLYTVKKRVKNGKQQVFGKEVSNSDTQSKLIYFSNNKDNASHRLTTKLNNGFIQKQPLDISSESVSNTPVITKAPHSSQKSDLPEGSDHSTKSHPTEKMNLIKAQSAITPFRPIRPNTSAVKNTDSQYLTGRTHSLNSVLSGQMPVKPSSHTEESILTLLPEDSSKKFASVTTVKHLTDKQDSQTFNTVNSIAEQASVDLSGKANIPVMEKTHTSTFTTNKAVVPLKLFLSEPRQDFDDKASTLTLTTLSTKFFSESLTMSRLLGSQSKITFDVSDDNHAAQTSQSFVKYNRDLIREPLIAHSLKLGDKNEQMLTVSTEDEDKENKDIQMIQQKQETRSDEKLGSRSEELFRSDKTESSKEEKIITTVIAINQNAERQEDKMKQHEAMTSREEDGGRQDKDPRQVEITDEEDARRRNMTDTNTENASKDGENITKDKETIAGKQSLSITKEGEEAERKVTANKKDIKQTTYVPVGPTTNLKVLNRDKGHSVTNLSSGHSLIKQLGVTEHKVIQPGEKNAEIVEMKNMPFSYKVTSNHRPVHSTLRSERPKVSKMASLFKESQHSHRPAVTKHEATSSLTKENALNKVVEATFSVTVIPKMDPKPFKVSTALHRSANKSAHSELNSISYMLSLINPHLVITTRSPSAQPHFTVNSSTLSVSIIYNISDHRNKFSASVSEADSLLQTMNEREQEKHTIPPHVFESGVKDHLTSNMIEEVNTSTSVSPASSQRMFNDSSTRPPTTAALSSEAHISNGQLQPHQQQPAPEISQSSSFDMTSGQPCSFKLSEKAAHSDALHAPADDNEQRSVQTLMASMSPFAKSDQFPLSSMSPLLNLLLFGGDSLPGTYGLMGLTKSASEKEILRANSNTEYANSQSDYAESLLETAEETNPTQKNNSVQPMVTSAVNHSDAITKQMAGNRDERNSFPFSAQTNGRSKHQPNKPDEFNSLSLIQTVKPGVNHNDEGNGTVKTALQNIQHLPQIKGDTETNTVTFAFETTHKILQTLNEEAVPVTDDFATLILDTNDQTGITAFVESDSLREIPKTQTNDVPNNSISDMEHHAAKATEKQHDPSKPRGSVSTLPVAQIHLGIDLKVPNMSMQQISDRIMNITSAFQITATKTNDYVSLAPIASISGLSMSTEAHESAMTTGENVQAVIEKSSQAAHTKHMVHSNSHIEPLSLREPPSAPTTGKHTPAVERKSTTETQSLEQPEHEISGQVIEQSRHASPNMIAMIRPINDPEMGIQASTLKAMHRAGVAHETTPNMVTDSVPPTGISPTEIINKTSCRTIGCATSDRTIKTTTETGEIDHTAQEKMYTTKAGSGGDHFNAVQTPVTKPENDSCGTGCPVPGKTTTQATNLDSTALSPVTSKFDHATVDETLTDKPKSMTDGPPTKTWRLLVETDHLARHGTPEQAEFVEKTTQRNSHSETSVTQEAIATEVTLSEPEATTAQTTEKTTEHTLFTEKNTKTQLNRGAAPAEIFEAQNANRVTEVSEDLCGSGNYTAEMSLNLGRGVEPGDAVPAMGNLIVVINLKTNNSQINLEVTSCCLSPTIQPDLTSSTCCLFSRLAAEPAGIRLLPSALSTSASFTISLFQMINYSVVYLHCDLSVCLRNHSDCERQCLQQRSAFPLEGPEAIVTNLRNRISFGPMLKEVKNSTLPEEIDLSELDLVLVIVSLAVGSFLVTVTLLLVWLAYHRRAIWLLHSAAPPRACCGCLHRGGIAQFSIQMECGSVLELERKDKKVYSVLGRLKAMQFSNFKKDDFEADWIKVAECRFGQVYQVKLKLWREKCALKSFDTTCANNFYRRIIDEAANIAAVKFKYIVSIYGLCSDATAMVMEYMSNGSLNNLLASHTLMWPKKFQMIHEASMGMNFLHSMQPPLLHLNLKMSNILLDDHLHVKISDFGLIHWEEGMNKKLFMEHLTARGNISYIPPETFTQCPDPPGTTFDVYSFGIVMWEILTQQKPYAGCSMTTVLLQVSHGKRPGMEMFPERKPHECDQMISIMKQCWDQDPKKRPQFLDTVRKTEALSEVLQIPGPIHCYGNGDNEKKSDYSCVVSPVCKISLPEIPDLPSGECMGREGRKTVFNAVQSLEG
ncbi:uncharacterized protein LOC121898295 isoform X1 [Scomber scombrus]|uniref:Uncharacterized protein LOC121898295 isoform X1 n=1 Tax=Scomber scombrus TaxID=13677 RepID=A0AAV1PCB2_SCOSC